MELNGWIKLHRKFKEWQWYKKSEMVHLFIHLLVSANFKDGFWQGIEIKRGQLVTGRKTLSNETGISEQSIRTCLSKFEKSGEINIKSTNKNSIITICKYDYYNDEKILSNQQLTSNQPATNQQPTSNQPQRKKEKKENNEKNYKNILLSEIKISDIDPKHVEYLDISKAFYGLFKNNLAEAGASTKTIEKAKGSWIDDVRFMIENDGYTIEDMRQVYKFLQKDAFWKKNILCTSKLRDKISQIKMQIHNGTHKQSNNEGCSWEQLAGIVKSAGTKIADQ